MSASFNVASSVGAARHPLVEARRSRGWSQEVLAHLIRRHGLGTTRKTVMRWERGVTPDPAAQKAMGELFEVDEQLRARADWPSWLPVDAPRIINAPWDLRGTIEALVETAERAIMDRRRFVLLVGAEVLLPVYTWRVNPGPFLAFQENGRDVSEDLVGGIEKLIEVRRTMDDERGGGGLLDMLHSDLRFVVNVLKNGSYPERIGRRLYAATAELARLAGWAAVENGRESAAQQYYFAALRSANAVGDHSLGVNIVRHLGIQAYSTNRPHDAAQLMEAATAESKGKTPEVVQAMAWAFAGRAYAKVGDRTAARRALTTSSTLMDQATGDAPAWSYWFDHTRVATQTGQALCDLGDHKGGQKEIAAAIQSWGGRYPRDRARLLGTLAISHLRTGDVDSACDSGTQAVDLLADQVDSDRARKLLRTFEKELASFKDSASAREFTGYAHSRLVTA